MDVEPDADDLRSKWRSCIEEDRYVARMMKGGVSNTTACPISVELSTVVRVINQEQCRLFQILQRQLDRIERRPPGCVCGQGLAGDVPRFPPSPSSDGPRPLERELIAMKEKIYGLDAYLRKDSLNKPLSQELEEVADLKHSVRELTSTLREQLSADASAACVQDSCELSERDPDIEPVPTIRALEREDSFNGGKSWGGDWDDVEDAEEPVSLWRRTWLERCSMGIVILNVFFLGAVAHKEARHRIQGEPVGVLLPILDTLFTVVFAVEIFARVWEYGWRTFFLTGSERFFNVFDTCLVCFSICDIMLNVIGTAILKLDFTYMRIIRLFRLLRVARIFKSVRLVRDLRVMLAAIVNSLFSMFWAVTVLIMVMYIYTLVIMNSLQLHWMNGGMVPPEVDKLYGSVSRTMRTLLEAITGGNDWANLLEPLEGIHYVYVPLFCFYVIVMVFGIMNILTAIFVDNASNLLHIDKHIMIQDELEHEEYVAKAIKKLFDISDRTKSGYITSADLEKQLQKRECVAFLRILGFEIGDLRSPFSALGLRRGEEVRVDSFVRKMMCLRGHAREVDLLRVMGDNRKHYLEMASFMMYVEDQFEVLLSKMNLKTSSRLSDYMVHHKNSDAAPAAPLQVTARQIIS